jgi:hypothetical protein
MVNCRNWVGVAGSAERAAEDAEPWALTGTDALAITASSVRLNNAWKMALHLDIFITNIDLSTMRTIKNR